MIAFEKIKAKHYECFYILSVKDFNKVFDTLFFYFQLIKIHITDLMHLQVVSFSIIAGAVYDESFTFSLDLHCLGPPS